MQIKICGITRAEDLRAAEALGVDAVGLVLWEGSKRAVSLEIAAALTADAAPFTSVAALVVDPSPQYVEQILAGVPINLLQWHGGESPEFCERWQVPYLRALKVVPGEDLRRQMDRFPNARGFLLDAEHGGQFGGTGRPFDWSLVAGEIDRPVILAGGLNPANVAEGIAAVRPVAVDVSSGVESSPGIKDHEKMKSFVSAVRAASEEQ